MQQRTPLVLIILDGWGYSEETAHNAIAKARTPFWDNALQNTPHTLLEASGEPVGLPHLQMGNSEVGHMHIGAGRTILQDFTRINQAIENNSFEKNSLFLDTITALKATNHTLHILGLLSPGGVHSHEAHLFAFLAFCKKHHFDNIALHLFLDGRDTPPKSALASIQRLNEHLSAFPNPMIASISGRFYALDRDKRWERIEPVYQLLTTGESAQRFESAEAAINAYYDESIYDEFIPPTAIGTPKPILDGDSVFFFNFRADRARELTEPFVLNDFSGFAREKKPKLDGFISMTTYADYLKTDVAFPPFKLSDTLGEALSKHHLRQLRIAETEKYAHVTFFLNGGREAPFPGEERILIPSPKVKTYDLQPEMSAPEITAAIVESITHKSHDVIICNYANADMVGHTGKFEATQQAIACLDNAMSLISQALEKVGGQLLITADHGNAESMFNEKTGQAHTAHTNHLVPLVFIGDEAWEFNSKNKGTLSDIAPTLLTLLGISPPSSMTGKSLLTREKHS